MKSFIPILIFLFSFNCYSIQQGWLGVDTFSGDTFGIGISFGAVEPKEIGWYGDMKSSGLGIKNSGVSYNLARNGFNDSEGRQISSASSITAGITYLLNDYFTFAGGIGLESVKKWSEFYDEFQILGDKGKYFVERDTSSQIVTSFRVLIKIPNNGYSLTFGYQSGNVNTFFGINWINY